MKIEDVKINEKTIKWVERKDRYGQDVVYKSEIIHHTTHLSISRQLWVDDKIKREEVSYIPIELIDEIQKLKPRY